MKHPIYIAASVLGLASALAAAPAIIGVESPSGPARATIDLAASEGVRAVQGEWRYSDVKIVETDFRGPGPDNQPSGGPVRTYDYAPHAGGADFDDSKWEVISPESLSARRGNGRISFNWYRINITVPETVNGFNTTNSTVVFETALDDYAEIWVDGEITRELGQNGGSVVAGWNAENRLVAGRNLRPGQKIQLAVFGMNGPISNPPTNFIWMRFAKLSFFEGDGEPISLTPRESNVDVVRLDPAIDEIIGPNPKVFKLAEGFIFTEGPVFMRDGSLLFSDPNKNRVYRYAADGALSIFRDKSGYDGADIDEYGQPGSNGLTLDPQGRLTVNQHGNHRVVRVEKDGRETVLADSFEGKRLNSPNDLVYRSNGDLYFTDPPFGLPKFYDDSRKELPFEGVFCLCGGKLKVVSKDLKGPNGIAFSPDEKYLYAGNWDPQKKIVMRYEVAADGSLSDGEVFFDMTAAPGEDALDGLKVDQRGNLYVSGPGGLWIISPAGKHLGTVIPPKHPHNFTWGGEDGKTLYMTARNAIYRMTFNIPGVRP